MNRRRADRSAAELGRFGEEQAAQWYVAHGYTIVDRNWRPPSEYGRGEVDLIVWRDDVVAFCEVKTRTSGYFGGGVAAVGTDKQRRLRRLARAWLHVAAREVVGGRSVSVRFDVADVDERGHLVLYEQAF